MHTPAVPELKDLLRRRRSDKQLNQEQLAAQSGVSPTMISHIETGRRLPGADTLELLIKALDVTAIEADHLRALRVEASATGDLPPELLKRLDAIEAVLERLTAAVELIAGKGAATAKRKSPPRATRSTTGRGGQ